MFPFFLETEGQGKRRLEAEARRHKWLCKQAVVFDEMKTKFQPDLCIKAPSYNRTIQKYRLFETKPIDISKHGQKLEYYQKSPTGKFYYGNQLLPKGEFLDLYQGQKLGKVCFTGDVIIPTLLNGERKYGGNYDVWMSITPAKILSQRQGARLATGNVMLGGLGLGWLLWQIAKKKSIKTIHVLEISEELMDWYGFALCEKIAKETTTEIKPIVGDALEYVGEFGPDVRHVLDIWDSFPHYPNREETLVANSVNHFWGWGWVA